MWYDNYEKKPFRHTVQLARKGTEMKNIKQFI